VDYVVLNQAAYMRRRACSLVVVHALRTAYRAHDYKGGMNKMDVLEVLQLFNIIKLMNTVFPPGVGELLVLLAWLGFWFLLCVMVICWVLTKEMIYTNTRSRISMEELAVVVYPGGSTKEFILPRNSQIFEMEMGKEKATWTIRNDEWMTKSNGVRFTYFHPLLPHNVSLNTLVKVLKSSKTIKLNEQDEVEIVPIENLTFTAYDQDAKIQTLAMAMQADLANPLAKFAQFAPWIALIFAIGVSAVMIMIVFPRGSMEAAAAAVNTATTLTTTTTIPAVSHLSSSQAVTTTSLLLPLVTTTSPPTTEAPTTSSTLDAATKEAMLRFKTPRTTSSTLPPTDSTSTTTSSLRPQQTRPAYLGTPESTTTTTQPFKWLENRSI
jgi:hypothetical protein